MPKRRDHLKELRAKGRPELERFLATTREQLRDVRFRVSANQHRDVRELRELRRTIAQVLTLLHHPTPASTDSTRTRQPEPPV